MNEQFRDDENNQLETNLKNDLEIKNNFVFIRKCQSFNKQDGDFMISEYLCDKFKDNELLKEGCLGISSTPSTQASVEHTFSVLGRVFTDLRMRMSPHSIEDLMLINSNRDIFYFIDFKDFI